MLRRSELAALELDDVLFERRGLVLTIRHSKRDQTGKGCVLGIYRGQNPNTCPVTVLRDWLKVRGKSPGPLFQRVLSNDVISPKGISGEAIHLVVKRSVELIGLKKKPYGSHSLRATGVTVAAEEGASDAEIMSRSRHRSSQMMRLYVRTKRAFPKHDPFRGAL
jgi:integrase